VIAAPYADDEKLRLNPLGLRPNFAIVPPSFWLLAKRHGILVAGEVRASDGESARQDNDIHSPMI
jgi:hypothetical protein